MSVSEVAEGQNVYTCFHPSPGLTVLQRLRRWDRQTKVSWSVGASEGRKLMAEHLECGSWKLHIALHVWNILEGWLTRGQCVNGCGLLGIVRSSHLRLSWGVFSPGDTPDSRPFLGDFFDAVEGTGRS